MYLSGLFTLRIPKETAGENFEGLQLLTSLLAPKGSRSAKPLVEDLSTGELARSSVYLLGITCYYYLSELFISKGCDESAADEEDKGEEEEEEEFDWQVEQQVYQENSEEELKAMQTYGFGNLRSGVFARLQVSLCVTRAASHLVCISVSSFRGLCPGCLFQTLFAPHRSF